MPINLPGNISVLVIDEQTLLRQGLLAMFANEPGIEIVGEGVDGADAIEKAATLRPAVVILSLTLPRMDSISTIRRIRSATPCPEVLATAGIHNETTMREAFEAGARAYLLKQCDFSELSFAVTKVAKGEFYLSGPGGSDVIAEYVRPVLEAQRPGGIMTVREREIAKLLADGYSTKEAAEVLNISPKTAETHRAAIMKKLGAKNVTDIVRYCIRNHLIEP
ncbi:response regulator [candidate division GN15 bacterium]|jgi:DNA-binding NarL/FixJ family response regulator|nr:response regulator [candidate division GN15 bacterium]